jgi:hypothetical protein
MSHPVAWNGNGFTARGDTVEEWLCEVFRRIERHLRVVLQQDVWFSAIGDRQETLIHEPLRVSATPDGFLRVDGETVYLEIKSIDPRVAKAALPKAAHVAQCQFGMELCRLTGHSEPQRAILIYVDASDYADITAFDIDRDAAAAKALLDRAAAVHGAQQAMDLPPEGLLDGGSECTTCALRDVCRADHSETVSGYGDGPLDDTVAQQLAELARLRDDAATQERDAKRAKDSATDAIRVVMDDNNASRADVPGFAIRYSVARPRETFDRAAAEEAGLDLSPYMRTSGNGTPRLTIRRTN